MVFKKIRIFVCMYIYSTEYICSNLVAASRSMSLDARNHTAEGTLAQPSLAVSHGLGVESGLGGLEQKLSNAVV